MPPTLPRRATSGLLALAFAACGAPRDEAAGAPAPELAPVDETPALDADGPPTAPVFGAYALWASTAEEPGEPRKEKVRRVVRGALMQVRLCYSVSLRTRPGLRGRLAALFEIAPDGSVAGVQIASELDAPEVSDCVRDVIAGLKFPALSSAAVVVNYPFALAP